MPTSPRHQTSRRRFLRTAALFFGVIGVSLATYFPVIAKWIPARLRPPGAIAEDEFLSSCIKCGQCVQVCPVEAIKLADLDEAMSIGTPYIDARAQACDFSCEAVQCILACPTGSLSHAIIKKEEVRMGLARVANPNACLALMGKGFKGIVRGSDCQGVLRYIKIDRWHPLQVCEHEYEYREPCDLCVIQCPINLDEKGNLKPDGNAISLQNIDKEGKYKMPVIHDTCVGCGVCAMICPVEPSVIVIDERKVWDGALL